MNHFRLLLYFRITVLPYTALGHVSIGGVHIDCKKAKKSANIFTMYQTPNMITRRDNDQTISKEKLTKRTSLKGSYTCSRACLVPVVVSNSLWGQKSWCFHSNVLTMWRCGHRTSHEIAQFHASPRKLSSSILESSFGYPTLFPLVLHIRCRR